MAALPISEDPPFLRRTAAGVTLALRVQPRARRTALEVDKSGALKAAVAAPPEDGKANAAVIDLLSREWRLPKAFEVVRGAAARSKTTDVTGDPATRRRWSSGSANGYEDVVAATWLRGHG